MIVLSYIFFRGIQLFWASLWVFNSLRTLHRLRPRKLGRHWPCEDKCIIIKLQILSELSMFVLQESSEATLYKWAKFLSMLNIILTSQQCEQQLQRTNRNEIQMVDNLTPRLGVDTPYLRAFLHTSGFSHVMRPRACLHGVTMPKRAWRINNERLCRNLLYVIVTIALSQHAHPYN